MGTDRIGCSTASTRAWRSSADRAAGPRESRALSNIGCGHSPTFSSRRLWREHAAGGPSHFRCCGRTWDVHTPNEKSRELPCAAGAHSHHARLSAPVAPRPIRARGSPCYTRLRVEFSRGDGGRTRIRLLSRAGPGRERSETSPCYCMPSRCWRSSRRLNKTLPVIAFPKRGWTIRRRTGIPDALSPRRAGNTVQIYSSTRRARGSRRANAENESMDLQRRAMGVACRPSCVGIARGRTSSRSARTGKWNIA